MIVFKKMFGCAVYLIFWNSLFIDIILKNTMNYLFFLKIVYDLIKILIVIILIYHVVIILV